MRSVDAIDLFRKGIVFLVFALMNCKDPISLAGEGNIGLLVIDGKVNTLPGPYTLRLGFTVGTDQKPNPVSLAHALLVDDDSGLTEEFSEADIENHPGVYTVPGAVIHGTPGHHYHVEVSLPDGRAYATKPEQIPDTTGVDSPYFEVGERLDYIQGIEVKVNVANVLTDVQLPPQGEKDYYLRWDVTETYMFEQTPIYDPLTGTIPRPCYVDGIPDGQRINVYSTRGQQRTHLDRLLIAQRRIDQSFLARHFFTIYQSSTTLESYNYWKNVNQLINRNGSIFDTPPAPIIGNAYSKTNANEKVLGYFEADYTTFTRFSLVRNDIPLFIEPYCNDPRYGIWYPLYPTECNRCTLLDNSTKTPPDWWPL